MAEPASSGFEADVTRSDDVCLVRVKGELDIEYADEFSERLGHIADRTVVVDLSELSFIDSSGFTVFIGAKHRATDIGQHFVLTRPQQNVARLFELLGLRDLLEPWRSEWDEVPARTQPTPETDEREAS